MKKLSYLLVIILAFQCCCVLSVSADKNTDNTIPLATNDLRSAVTVQGDSVDTIIAEALESNPNYITWSTDILIQDRFGLESYWWDTSMYAVEYAIFADDLFHMAEGEGIKEILENQMYPYIYVPIFGVKNEEERIIGHVSFSWAGDRYKPCTVIWPIEYETFWTEEPTHFLEVIGAFDGFKNVLQTYSDSTIKAMTLFRFLSAYNGGHDKILVLETDDDLYLYDITNAAHAPETEAKKAYSLDEFAALRLKYEESVSNKLIDLKPNVAGGLVPVNNTVGGSWLWGLVALTILCGGIVIIVVKKRKKI